MSNRNPTFKELIKDSRLLLAFGFGSGLSPKMPGTVGTLFAIPLFLALAQLPYWAYLSVILISTIVGIYLCQYAAEKLQVHDHSGIVWDEFVGYWIAMFALPINWITVLLGFLLFRLFDIVKPWPISIADKRLKGGIGIMLDDILAGLAAWLCMQGLLLGGLL